jgi:hypothetical protein
MRVNSVSPKELLMIQIMFQQKEPTPEETVAGTEISEVITEEIEEDKLPSLVNSGIIALTAL